MEDLNKTLSELNTEDILWIITLFTAIAALISNQYERDYLFTHQKEKKKEYKTINITLLIISFFISLYFLILSYRNLKNLKPHASFKKELSTNVNFLASSLVIIASVLYIMIEIFGDDDAIIDFFV